MAAKHEVFDAGSWQQVTRCEVLDTGGVWRNIKRREVLDADGATWRTVAVYAPPFSVTVDPSVVSGAVSSGSPETVFTNAATATPVGGTAPYTYAWTNAVNSGGTAPFANSPSLATTIFHKPNVTPGDGFSDTMRVTATDAFGFTATFDILAEFINTGGIS